MMNIPLSILRKFFISLFILIGFIFNPYATLASNSTDPSVIGLQNRISSNFTNKYCKAINFGYSKDEAMRSAIIETENIVAFSLNPQKKWIVKEDLADQISIRVVNKCGWSFGLVGKEGVDYFKRYFLEINEKTTPGKKLSG